MFKRSKEQEKKGSEKREDLLVSFLKDAHFVFAIINGIIKFATDKGYVPIWKEKEDGLYLFVPYQKDNIEDVAMGFCFDKGIITPINVRYRTKVYKLLRYYPHDEKTIDFYFDLEKKSDD